MNQAYLLSLLTLIICFGIAWACLCRLAKIRRYHPRRVLIRYALMMTGAIIYGMAPVFFGEWHGITGVIFSAAVLVTMVLSVRQWYEPGSGRSRPSTRLGDHHGA